MQQVTSAAHRATSPSCCSRRIQALSQISRKHLSFLKKALEQLVSLSVDDREIRPPVRPGRFRAESSNLLRLEFSKSKHWPVLIPATAAKKNPWRDCVVCKSHGEQGTSKRWVKGESRKRVESKFMCGGCDGQPALCVTPCFRCTTLRETTKLDSKVYIVYRPTYIYSIS